MPHQMKKIPQAVRPGGKFQRRETTMKTWSGGFLLSAAEFIAELAYRDVKTGVAIGAVSYAAYRRLSRWRMSRNAARNLAVTHGVISGNLVENLFCGVHATNYTRMDSRMQCTNGRLFANSYSRINTGLAMKKTPAQMIADALDAAMETANNGKRMSQAELSRRSGVPQPTISRTLSGNSIPEVKTIAPLVAVLGARNVDLQSSISALLPPATVEASTQLENDLLTEIRKLDPIQQGILLAGLKAGASKQHAADNIIPTLLERENGRHRS